MWPLRMSNLGCVQVNISVVVDDQDAPKCVEELHKVFWPDQESANVGTNGQLY